MPVVQLTKHNSRDSDRCLSNVCCHDNLEEVIDHEERIGGFTFLVLGGAL